MRLKIGLVVILWLFIVTTCFSQGRIKASIELNNLRGNYQFNDSIFLVSSESNSWSPGISYLYGFSMDKNFDLIVGVEFTHFGEQFALLEDTSSVFPSTSTIIKEFFRFKFPISAVYSLKWMSFGFSFLPTLNLGLIYNGDFEYLNVLDDSFNRFNLGMSFNVKIPFSQRFSTSLYYNTYLTPQFSIEESDFKEYAYGIGVIYRMKKKE